MTVEGGGGKETQQVQRRRKKGRPSERRSGLVYLLRGGGLDGRGRDRGFEFVGGAGGGGARGGLARSAREEQRGHQREERVADGDRPRVTELQIAVGLVKGIMAGHCSTKHKNNNRTRNPRNSVMSIAPDSRAAAVLRCLVFFCCVYACSRTSPNDDHGLESHELYEAEHGYVLVELGQEGLAGQRQAHQHQQHQRCHDRNQTEDQRERTRGLNGVAVVLQLDHRDKREKEEKQKPKRGTRSSEVPALTSGRPPPLHAVIALSSDVIIRSNGVAQIRVSG